jgi:flagellar biosynthesis/type III secretory pathway M-ring protein FliF/YscJ
VEDALAALLIFVVLVAAVALVTAPLRRGHAERLATREQVLREELEAAKEAKYREIRDAEMDYRTGKLSEADYRALDRELRGEAVEILRDLDQLP